MTQTQLTSSTLNTVKSPWAIMLCGIPGSGKSTWIRNSGLAADIISSDDHIELYATSLGKTYNDVFHSFIKEATRRMFDDFDRSIINNSNIIWDQTNVTRKSRASKIGKIPSHYAKIAVCFAIPDEKVLKERLDSRQGKHIPDNVMKNLISSFEPPETSEGFDLVIFVDTTR